MLEGMDVLESPVGLPRAELFIVQQPVVHHARHGPIVGRVIVADSDADLGHVAVVAALMCPSVGLVGRDDLLDLADQATSELVGSPESIPSHHRLLDLSWVGDVLDQVTLTDVF